MLSEGCGVQRLWFAQRVVSARVRDGGGSWHASWRCRDMSSAVQRHVEAPGSVHVDDGGSPRPAGRSTPEVLPTRNVQRCLMWVVAGTWDRDLLIISLNITDANLSVSPTRDDSRQAYVFSFQFRGFIFRAQEQKHKKPKSNTLSVSRHDAALIALCPVHTRFGVTKILTRRLCARPSSPSSPSSSSGCVAP